MGMYREIYKGFIIEKWPFDLSYLAWNENNEVTSHEVLEGIRVNIDKLIEKNNENQN